MRKVVHAAGALAFAAVMAATSLVAGPAQALDAGTGKAPLVVAAMSPIPGGGGSLVTPVQQCRYVQYCPSYGYCYQRQQCYVCYYNYGRQYCEWRWY